MEEKDLLMELVAKQKLTLDEFETVIESEFVTKFENNGISGLYPDWLWYVVTIDDNFYDIYVQ